MVDAKGAQIGCGRNLPELRTALSDRMLALRRKAAESATGYAGRKGMREWPADLSIPESEEIKASGMPVTLFPALSLREDSVELRRFPSRAEADLSHREALRALLEWNADGSDHLLAWLSRDLLLPVDIALPGPMPGSFRKGWENRSSAGGWNRRGPAPFPGMLPPSKRPWSWRG